MRALSAFACLILAVATAAADPVLQEATEPAPPELVSQIVAACGAWLRPPLTRLAYNYSMVHLDGGETWRAAVEFTAPNALKIGWGEGKSYEGAVDDRYDPANSAYPPKLITILQGTTFFGPLHELVLKPEGQALTLVREEKLGERDAVVVQLRPRGEASPEAVARWEERLRGRATRPQYLYEFVPVSKTVDGAEKVVLAIRCLKQEGPGWAAIKAAHEADPSRLCWGGLIITAEVRDYRGEQKPVVVINKDPAFAGESPIRLTQFAGGVNNMTPGLTLGEGEKVLDEQYLKQLQADTPRPESCLAMRLGCGIWGCWYGYTGSGATVDQVWFDRSSHLPLREEGFAKGTLRFVIEYSDFQQLPEGWTVPRHVVVTLAGNEAPYPWVFDMTFKPEAGAWLLEKLSEYSQGTKLTTTAAVTDVVAQGGGR